MDQRKPFMRTLSAVLIAAFILSLVPILYAARYNLPDSDDLLFNAGTTFEQRLSLRQALSDASAITKTVYEVANGRYAASYLASFYLYWTTLVNYWAVSFFVLGLFVFCLLYFSRAILVDVLHADKFVWLSLSFFVLLCYTQFLPSAAEAFFWLCGAVSYTVYIALDMLFLGLLLRIYIRKDGVWKNVLRGVLAVALSAAAAGMGYSIMFVTAGLLAGFIVLAIVKRRRDCLLWGSLALAVFLVGNVVQFTAPGLAVRSVYEAEFYGLTHVPNAPKAVLESFTYAAGCLIARLDPSMLLFVALTVLTLLPYLKRSGYSFRLPWLITVVSFCLFATEFTVSLYAQGYMGPLRQRNMIYFTEFWFWGVNATYWAGWLLRQAKTSHTLSALEETWRLGVMFVRSKKLLVLGLCILMLTATAFARDVNTTTSVAALKETLTGSAKRRYETRLEEILSGMGDYPGEREDSRIFYY